MHWILIYFKSCILYSFDILHNFHHQYPLTLTHGLKSCMQLIIIKLHLFIKFLAVGHCQRINTSWNEFHNSCQMKNIKLPSIALPSHNYRPNNLQQYSQCLSLKYTSLIKSVINITCVCHVIRNIYTTIKEPHEPFPILFYLINFHL
jgi:hypothetical protein